MLKTSVPMGEKVIDDLLEMIAAGRFEKDKRLPADREFAEHFKVNRQTIHRAMSVLAERGIVERRIGSGTVLTAGPDEISGRNWRTFSRRSERKTIPIGLIIDIRPGSFATSILAHLQDLSAALGIDLTVQLIPGEPGPALEEGVRKLARGGCECVILMVSNLSHWGVWVHELLRDESLPPLVLNTVLPNLEPYHFNLGRHRNSDSLAHTMRFVMEYLCRLGHDHIAFLGPYSPEDQTLIARQMSYCRLIQKAGRRQLVALIEDNDDLVRYVRSWQELPGSVAVICYDDDYALMLLNLLHFYKIPVPEKFALVGFNDITAGRMTVPPLTTVPFDYEYIARAVLECCLSRIAGRPVADCPPRPHRIIIRESCGGRARLGDRAEEVADRVAQELDGIES